MASSLLVPPSSDPLLRLPCPPPAPELITRFGLLLRRLSVLHGWTPLRDMDADVALGLLDRCAASEADRSAVRAFTPLVSCGFLRLLDRSTPDRSEVARTIARQVTIRPEQLEQIATRISPLVSVTPVPAIEALALAGATRRSDLSQPSLYNGNLWLGVGAVIAAAAAGLLLLAAGARRSLSEREAAAASQAVAATTPPAVPAPPVAAPAPRSTPTPSLDTAPLAATLSEPPVATAAAALRPAPASAAAPAPASASAAPAAPRTAAEVSAWRSCAALPAAAGPTAPATVPLWSVLAPSSSLEAVRRRCRADAPAVAGGVLVARFAERSQAERLIASLAPESGLPLQLAPPATP